MNIPDAELTRVYNRGYEIAFQEQPHVDGTVWKLAGVRAIAEWARKEALREAAEMVRDYWDVCGELIDTNNGARLAFEAVAAKITDGATS